MAKRLLAALFVLCVVAAMCHAGAFVIAKPQPGEKIQLKSDYNIVWYWTLDGLDVLPTHVRFVLFKGGKASTNMLGNISQNLPIGDAGWSHGGKFLWKAGEYEGGPASAGNDYYIQAVTSDVVLTHDNFQGPFSLFVPVLNLQALTSRYIEFNPDPGCPMCGIFEVGSLLAQLGNPAGVAGNLVLLRNGRQVGLLGKLGSGGLLPTARVRLKFPADDFALIGRGGEGFEVAIIGDSGNILKRAPISLKMKQ